MKQALIHIRVFCCTVIAGFCSALMGQTPVRHFVSLQGGTFFTPGISDQWGDTVEFRKRYQPRPGYTAIYSVSAGRLFIHAGYSRQVLQDTWGYYNIPDDNPQIGGRSRYKLDQLFLGFQVGMFNEKRHQLSLGTNVFLQFPSESREVYETMSSGYHKRTPRTLQAAGGYSLHLDHSLKLTERLFFKSNLYCQRMIPRDNVIFGADRSATGEILPWKAWLVGFNFGLQYQWFPMKKAKQKVAK